MKLQATYLADNTGEEATLDVTEIFLYKDINTTTYPVNEISISHLMNELSISNQLNIFTENFSVGQVDAIKGIVDVQHGQREAIKLTRDGEVVWERKEHTTPSN